MNRQKICRRCKTLKPDTAFTPNRIKKGGVITRRAYCLNCERKQVRISPRDKSEFEAKNPRPTEGQLFTCPVCQISVIVGKNTINLDHDNKTSRIRGYICVGCNTAIGKLNDDVRTLKRAIRWLKGKL